MILLENGLAKIERVFAQIQQTVRQIARGHVSTYGEVARAAGYPGCARQVVWALRAARGLPWHRVVGAGGKILLQNHNAMEQRLRLEMEGVTFRNGKVDLKQHAFAWRRKAKAKAKVKVKVKTKKK